MTVNFKGLTLMTVNFQGLALMIVNFHGEEEEVDG